MPDTVRDWSVYLVRCRDGSLYTGIATDVTRRFDEHVSGQRGAKYLRGRGPLALVFQQQVGSRSAASRVEHYLRRLPRRVKENTEMLPARIEQILTGK